MFSFGNTIQYISQRRIVEDFSYCVPNVLHHHPDAARSLVATFFTLSISRLADAWYRGKRAFKNADDFPHADIARRFTEVITASLPLFAHQDAAVLQRKQNELEELFRNLFLPC